MTVSPSIYSSVSSALTYFYALRSLKEFFSATKNGYFVNSDVRDQHEDLRARINATHVRLAFQLDKSPAMDPTLMARLRKQLDWRLLEQARAYRKRFYSDLAKREMSPLDKIFYGKLADRSRMARQYDHVSRMVWEMTEADRNDWFPVFVTLTVRPAHYNDVFSVSSRCFREYIRTIRRQIGRRLGMSKRVAEVEDIHRYFAVVERGGLGDRLHVHVLHFCKALPVAAIDPNCGRLIADRRQLPSWCRAWNFGFATAYPVRTGPQDIYGRLGWRWPVERVKNTETWQPYPSKGPRAVAAYMGKYIAKNYTNKRKDLWRCRMSRNLGTRLIHSRITQLPSRNLLSILRNPLPTLRHHGRTVSHHLVRRIAARQLLHRHASRTAYVKALSTLAPALSLHRMRTNGTSLIPNTMRSVDFSWLSALFDRPRQQIQLRGLATGLSL